MELIRKVEHTIIEERLFEPGDRIVVAVSGGPDSVALLHLLFLLSKEWDWQLMIGHVNHLFREESEEEARFVTGWARELGIPCEVGVVDVPRYIEQTGDNPQNAARQQRYLFLASVAKQFGTDKLALAHHADDQAETVMMRLIRGTGPAGLVGMTASNKLDGLQLIRPLLRIYKEELEQYCHERELTYYVDGSNLERKYFRNQVRLDVIPKLSEYNPNFVESLHRLSFMMKDEDDFMEKEIQSLYERMVRTDTATGERTFSTKVFTRLHVALQRRLIKLILNYLSLCADSVDFATVESLREAIIQRRSSSLTLDVSDQIRFFKEYDRIGFVRNYSPARPFRYPLGLEQGDLYLAEAGIYLETFVSEAREHPDWSSWPAEDRAVLDLDRLELPIIVRSRQDGDRMQVLGLNGSKKVKDIFIDAKIAHRERNLLPLVVDGAGRIIWIPGIKRSVHARVTDRTTRFLHIRVSRKGMQGL
ncbi:tRNA lysidine(34) synthetase TilS [Paenibacillus sp. J2TS4]|uniref:tRNA lysidine(34) synthetase TilS n=1 Tax=Paenibacillus sp. J2TS4 TaxID=2807194 RepID=UPI001B052635|nr:tRNA lysidine(34) synthetase TilS [Paenibacillus sp. J2TS4]GIP36351.1 hypothetical protein J2TS4_55610 [Paenibacillus sp. J2TS4]